MINYRLTLDALLYYLDTQLKHDGYTLFYLNIESPQTSITLLEILYFTNVLFVKTLFSLIQSGFLEVKICFYTETSDIFG